MADRVAVVPAVRQRRPSAKERAATVTDSAPLAYWCPSFEVVTHNPACPACGFTRPHNELVIKENAR